MTWKVPQSIVRVNFGYIKGSFLVSEARRKIDFFFSSTHRHPFGHFNIFNLKMRIGEERRYALLQAAQDSEYVKKVYGGYLNVYVQTFGEEGERWDLFRVYEGEFPDFTQLHSYDGFVVTGSPHDAYGNDYWILKLCFLLQTLDAMEKKVLGICFGHQVIKLHHNLQL